MERELFEWERLRRGRDGDTSTSFTDNEQANGRKFVYRVMTANTLGTSSRHAIFDWLWDSPYRDAVVDLAATDTTTEDGGAGDGSPNTGNTGGESANTPASGAPTIDGTPQVGETLTASISSITDADGLTNVAYSYQWTAGGSDINGATGSTYMLTSSEQGKTIQVRVTFTDDSDNAETLTSAATVAVAAPANRPPRIRGEDRPNYAENGTRPVVAYTLEDPDAGDKITWSLEGTDGRHMELSQDGVLSFKEPPDYENPVDSRFDNTYEVTLRATDDGSPSQNDIHRVRVTVTNVDEAPVISGPDAVEYEENEEDGVATYTAADPEDGDVASWGLAGDDAGLFSISDAGELAFSDAPDFEAPLDTDEDNVYSVTIQATDASDIMGTMDVAITVTDAEADGMVGKYDMNGDKLIDKDEAIVAVSDYFSGLITKEEVLEVVNQYFAG